jgi:hypothetical protein
MSKAISEIFDVTPVPAYNPPERPVEDSSVDADVNLARSNLKNLMDFANDALKGAIDVALASESPKAFESITGLINAAADLNTKLIATHQNQQKMRIDAGAKPGAQLVPTNVTNNNSIVFTGTPAELARLMNKGNNNE